VEYSVLPLILTTGTLPLYRKTYIIQSSYAFSPLGNKDTNQTTAQQDFQLSMVKQEKGRAV
jgi:hypothetical protein